MMFANAPRAACLCDPALDRFQGRMFVSPECMATKYRAS